MTVEMTAAQLERLIAAMRGGGRGEADEAAVVVGPMGPCDLGKDKLKRPKRWSDWRREAENKMRFLKIKEDKQKLNFIKKLRRCEVRS